MSTLDEYFAPRAPARGKDAIACMVLVSVDLGDASGGYTLAFKLHALLRIIRELQTQAGCAVVGSISDYLLIRGIVRSESEVPKLLRLAHREGLITQGSIPSTWMVGDHDATHFARYAQSQAVTAV